MTGLTLSWADPRTTVALAVAFREPLFSDPQRLSKATGWFRVPGHALLSLSLVLGSENHLVVSLQIMNHFCRFQLTPW